MNKYLITYYDYYHGEKTAVVMAESEFCAMCKAQTLIDYGYVNAVTLITD